MIHRATTTPSSVSPALPPVSTSTSVPPSAACSLTLPSRMGPPSWLASGEVIYADLMLRDPKVSMSGCVHIRLGATIHGVQPDPTIKGVSRLRQARSYMPTSFSAIPRSPRTDHPLRPHPP